jgi:hypothetical protein
MESIDEIRRKALRLIVDRRFNGVSGQLADAVKRPRPNISQVLSGKRPFGESLARDIERILDLERGHLDREESSGTVSELLARIAPILDAAPPDLRQAVLALALKYDSDPAEGARIAAAIRALLGVADDPAA